MPKQILLIDDDINLGKVIGYQLEQEGYKVDKATRGKEGLSLFTKNGYDMVISDIQMPDISGIDVLNEIRRKDKKVIVIMITAYGSVDNAIEACRLGADDYITKPFGKEQLLFTIGKALRLRDLQNENLNLRHELVDKFRFDNMVAQSGPMQEVLRITSKVAASNATVLILGESGTGKELIARAIHFNSARKDKPFVTVNCPSIPDNLLESELFGHVKGAFTGAVKDRPGKFELANGGTIFLDEIGDLKEDLQAKLLRVLQEREYDRVGGGKPIKTDVRILAATNQDLLELVKEKKFREDLYYRLSVVPIVLPPLRERREDIPFLIDFFLERFGGGRNFTIDATVVQALKNYSWPGNVRELENIIERMVTLSADDRITLKDLPSYILSQTGDSSSSLLRIPEEGISLEAIEKQVILEVLKRTDGNQSQAARLLQIPRHVLLYKIKKLGI
ncbi:MAG TPA: sigma-54-dependent Fis family transcriptional regulator [Caldithrix abyssi]|uniref:Sigma-54-dependent Fis family transcriptional regulator n=1 Tax=Caldithrix abyssi TaxID=187145 RepID=A0A7V4U2J2_CALAY|nr:sigma-54-dependent Fis family transcriptional regulator [Caldithrix abyssi]